MSNGKKVKKISEIATDIKSQSNEDLEGKLFRVSEALSNATKIIAEKDAEIAELKKHLDALAPHLSKLGKITVSDEEIIANYQLSKIKEIVLSGRLLTAEESKIFDIMVKNKKIAQGDASQVIDVKGLPKNTPKEELLKIAATQVVKKS